METSATSTKTLEEIFVWDDFQASLLWFLARIAIRLDNAYPPELVKVCFLTYNYTHEKFANILVSHIRRLRT